MTDQPRFPAPPRGAAAVGFVTELDAVPAAAVLYLRLWTDGLEGRQQMRDDLRLALGPEGGEQTLTRFGQLCELCVRHGRRPLMRHHLTCRCLGADESCFAQFIATAAEGAREDAILIATLLVRPDMAIVLAGLAQDVGLAFRRMASQTSPRSDRQDPIIFH